MHIRILILWLMMLPTASQAAVDMFLDIDTVQGESQDNAHRGEIDVLAWAWGQRASAMVNHRLTQTQTQTQSKTKRMPSWAFRQ